MKPGAERYEITITHNGKFVKTTILSRSLQASQEERDCAYAGIDAYVAALEVVRNDVHEVTTHLLAMLKDYEEESKGSRGTFMPISATVEGVIITMGDEVAPD